MNLQISQYSCLNFLFFVVFFNWYLNRFSRPYIICESRCIFEVYITRISAMLYTITPIYYGSPYGPNYDTTKFSSNLFSVVFQGFTVALFYCFLNTEVQNTLRHHIERWKESRDLGARGRRYTYAKDWSPKTQTESIRYWANYWQK